MLISDWSSDVCSSDLPVGRVEDQPRIVERIGCHRAVRVVVDGEEDEAFVRKLALQRQPAERAQFDAVPRDAIRGPFRRVRQAVARQDAEAAGRDAPDLRITIGAAEAPPEVLEREKKKTEK